MPNLYASNRAKVGTGAASFIVVVICSLLGCLLSTPRLYGHPANAYAPAAPAEPGDLTAISMSGSRIDLAWVDNANNESGFKIEIKVSAAGAYIEMATVAANVTNYSSTGLEASTQYFYRVRAYNADGHSGYSNEASATTAPNLPLSPGNLAAVAVTSNKINITWTDNSNNETGFKIERKLTSATTFNQIATIGANVTSYSSAGLTPNTSYAFRVRAYNAIGNSDYSNTASATSLINLPKAPSALTATAVSSSQINLAWTDNSANEDSFKIERSLSASGPFTPLAAVGANISSYSDAGLNGGTAYYYRVRAKNTSGQSGYSNVVNVTTKLDPPAAPSNLSFVTIGNSQVNLSWTDNSTNEDSFKVERKIGVAGTFAQIASIASSTVAGTGAQIAFSNTGLTPDTQYFYRVFASNTGGNSALSNEINITTPQAPPAAPSNLIAIAVNKSRINLAWTDNANDEIGFKIERKTGATGVYAQIATLASPNLTSYADTTGAPNTEYFYRVRAFNINPLNGNNSAYSNEASATTFMNGPSNLIATTASDSQINLTWTDNSSTETGFRIERKTGSTGTYAIIATVNKNVKNYSDLSLSASTQYFYRVHAFNATNVSGYTNEANATTLLSPPAAPSNLAVIAVSNTQINLTWADNSNNELGFKIERKTGAVSAYTEIATVSASVQSYSNVGLTGLTQYFYRVRSYNADGNSGYTDEKEATTLIDPPAAPSGLSATAVSSNQINLSWTDNASNEDGFRIERKTGSAGTYALIGTVAQNAMSFSDSSVDANTQYFYRVRAFNTVWTSPYSNEASVTTAPAAPSNLIATAVSKSRINLFWTSNSNNEIGFKIERKTAGAGAYIQIKVLLSPNLTSYVDPTGAANTKYFYRVRAFNVSPIGGDNSAYSNEASATTFMNGPSNLVATAVGDGQINLTWTDNSVAENGFQIERKTGPAGIYVLLAMAAQNVTSFSDNLLSAGTQYFYRVRAFSATNVSGYTNEANATTAADGPPVAPSNLTATAVGKSRIILLWKDNANNEIGFKVERKDGTAGTYAQIAALVIPNLTSYTDTTGAANTKYFYRVRAFDISPFGGNSAYSNEASATTFMNGPSNLVAKAVSSSQIKLTWTDNTFNETGFQIERSTSTDGPFSLVGTAAQNVTSFSNTDLSASTPYFYRVRAINANNFSGYSNVSNSTTLASASPAKAPSALTASDAIPEAISLAENYPNPFSASGTFGNPSTSISFSLPAGANVSLKVVNVTGQAVATLVDGYRDRGIHRVTFKAAKLPSGVYYAVLKVGEITQVKRMTLAK